MCGRYAFTRKNRDLVDEFDVTLDVGEEYLEPDYNVAPTKPVPAILVGAAGRELHTARWGLVPAWAKDAAAGSRMINARVETVHEKPVFRRAFARRRCLLPADGYFEWITDDDGRKRPFFIRPRDGGIVAMAGLFETWRSPAGESLLTCTVITTTAIDELGHIHDRMPMFVDRDRREAWLDPGLSGTDEVRSLLVPAAAGRFEAVPVSTAVNNVRNNGPELVEPVQRGDNHSEYPPTLF
jgi:putative SOS response-associated peptidase YedK